MTVQYSQLVLTGGPAVFLKLLIRWRGSVFKLIYIDIIIFSALYAIMSSIYRFALPESSQRAFERLIIFTNRLQNMIPVAFILGFYIQLVFQRFWTHFITIPWALKFAMALASHLPGKGERPRLMRRTCIRYVLSSLIISATRLHLVAKKRFPTPESFVAAGILSEEELKLLLDVQPAHVQPFVPLIWATSIITLAGRDRLITNRHALSLMVDELNSFRQGLLDLFMMDHISIPLVYTQVVTLAVYSYFAASLVGRQYIVADSPYFEKLNVSDLYFPFFTILEFIIYVGWLKVAETLVNPMGEDDEDIDINEVIDFNWKVSWSIVDGMWTSPPAVVRDIHWYQSVIELPHTEESRRYSIQPLRGSVYDINSQLPPDILGSMASVCTIGHSQDLSAIKNTGNTTNSLKHLPNVPELAIQSTQSPKVPHRTIRTSDAVDNLASDGTQVRSTDRKLSTDNAPYALGSHSVLNVNKVIAETIVEEDEELENPSDTSATYLPNKEGDAPVEIVVSRSSSSDVEDETRADD